MRFRASLRRQLEARAREGRRSVSDLAQELLDEALRMRECPGIYFALEPTGRTAKVAGTGLGVWEVLRDFTDDQDGERLREAFPELSGSQFTAALMYFNRYPEEVQRQIDVNAALTPEVLRRRYPGLIRAVPSG